MTRPRSGGGGFNMQPLRPRDGESEVAAAWIEHLASKGAHHAHIAGPTRIGPDGESQIDGIAFPEASAGVYSIRKAWKRSLSDHAMIYADPCTSKPARRNEALSPAEFKSLPDEARADLRRLYHNLEITFSIPKVDLTNLLQPDAYDGFSAPGHLPRDHPANDDNDEEDNGHTGSPSDPGAVDVSPPWLPLLMLFGRATLSATFRDWLSHWRKRSKCTNPGHILHSAAKREEAFTPVGSVAAWLTDSGWDGSTLSPAAARTWLARWNADQTQRRAAAIQQYRLGREIFKKAHMMSGIRAADGTW